MKLTIINTLNLLQAGYVIMATITLIVSFIFDWTFFLMSIASWILKKAIDFLFLASHFQKLNKNEFVQNILGYQTQKSQDSPSFIFAIGSIILFILYQDFILWYHLLSKISQLEEQIYEGQYFNLAYYYQITQLTYGLLLKGFCVTSILSFPESIVGKDEIFQSFFSFIWICSLQGLFLFLAFNYTEVLWIIISIKILSVSIHSLIAYIYNLEFYGCDGKDYFSIVLIGGMIQLLNGPNEYAPFYSKKWTGDYKQIQISTQIAMHIFKFFQTIEVSVNVVLNFILLSQLKNQQVQINSKNYQLQSIQIIILTFFLICGLTTVVISVIHLIVIVKGYLNDNYRFFSAESLSLEKTCKILENSEHLTYLKIKMIPNFNKIKNNLSLEKRLLQGLIKHQTKQLKFPSQIEIEHIIEMSSSTKKYIHINNFKQLQHAFLEFLQNLNNPFPKCVLFAREQIEYSDFMKCIIQRVFNEGITYSTKECISMNYIKGNYQGMIESKSTLIKFQIQILEIIAFYKMIFPFLLTNPSQVLYDQQVIENSQ